MHRTMAVVLLGMSLLIQSHVVTADATPYPAQILGWCSYNQLNNIRYGCGFTSPAQACSAAASATGLVFDHFDMTDGYAAGRCWYSDSGLPSLPLDTYHRVWTRNTYCYRGGQEEDYTVAAPICSCRGFPPGYVYPPGGPGPGLPLCVPGTCPVDPLPVYSPDPYPLDIANLAPRMQTALQCLQAAIGRQTSPGGNPGMSTVDSAYRPSSYNRHLQEVWDKWMRELIENDRPECQSLRTEVRNHFNSHDLIPSARARPHTNSAHTRGQAFDLSSNLYDGVLDVLAVDCNVVRPDPLGDPPHFIHR